MILFSINTVPEKNPNNKKLANLKMKRKEKIMIFMENQHKKLKTNKGKSRK